MERLTAESSTTIAAFKSAILKTLQETAVLQLRETWSNIDLPESAIMLCTPKREQLHVLNLHVVSLGCRWVLLHSVIHPSSYYFCPGALVSARKASVFTKRDEPLCKRTQQMNSRFKQQMELGFYLVDLDMILALLHQLSTQIPSEFWKPETAPVHTSNINYSI